jgi:hypothetical protein
MNGMRALWLVGALLVGAAAALLLTGGPTEPARTTAEPQRREAPTAAGPAAGPTAAAPAAAPATAAATAATAAQAAPSPAAQASPPAATGSDAPPRAPVVRAKDAVDLGLDQQIKDAKVVAGNIVPRKDRNGDEMLLYADGKYEIRGKGTEESPYRVSWECLASASESYMPRLNEREIPQRIALLNGKVVEVEGYLAFPLMVSEAKELLVMLNQWDGCCIGVPPTPYDAIEVKLVEPAKRGGKHATFNYGGVRGTLKVDPYLVENWLVGLYILENAKMIEGAKPEL